MQQQDHHQNLHANNNNKSSQQHHQQQIFNRLQNSTFKYDILAENSNNQIIQFTLMPCQYIYHQGQIIYSNSQLAKNKKFGVDNIFEIYKLYTNRNNNLVLNKLQNNSVDIVYYGLQGKMLNGKILVLDTDTYGQNFYIKPINILLTNVGQDNAKITSSNKLKQFKKGDFLKMQLNNPFPLYILQSRENRIIIQKSLGSDQRFYCKQQNVIAFSEFVQIVTRQKNGWLVVKGPGWIFLQNSSNYTLTTVDKGFNFVKIFCLIYIIWMIMMALSQAILILNDFH